MRHSISLSLAALAITLLLAPLSANALHGNPVFSGTLIYCADFIACTIFEESNFQAYFHLETDYDTVIDHVQSYEFCLEDTAVPLFTHLDSDLTFEDFTTITDAARHNLADLGLS